MTNEKKVKATATERSATERSDTIGAIYSKNILVDTGTDNAMELAGAMSKSFESDLYTTVDVGLKLFPGSDFYVVILAPEEKALNHILRDRFFPRKSPPTPQFNQTVYHYKKKDDSVEFLWMVPDKESVYYFVKNRKFIKPEDYFLLQQCLDFVDGTLYKKALKLNGEAIIT